MHVYVDETKARAYLLVAAATMPSDVATVERAMRSLLLKGQRRVHMVAESDARRRAILDKIKTLGVEVTIYRATGTQTQILRRRACIEALVKDIAPHCRRLTLESDESQDARDRQQLVELTRTFDLRDRLTYEHRAPHQEPLLWVPDAVGWAHARGGHWRTSVMPLIAGVVDV